MSTDNLPVMVADLLALPSESDPATCLVAADRALQAALIALARATCLLSAGQGKVAVQMAHGTVEAARGVVLSRVKPERATRPMRKAA